MTSEPDPTTESVPNPGERALTGEPPRARGISGISGISADWASVLVAAVIVLLAVVGLLPSIPFLVK